MRSKGLIKRYMYNGGNVLIILDTDLLQTIFNDPTKGHCIIAGLNELGLGLKPNELDG
eukprot:gnl/Chilomastix_caulleri/4758.p1 GENE.gnl/Chilomastix_caulleri/4758~~gnl/Chilomastix_caulleri/4758.p1  ORF type:complete len:58 (+),score=9.26 gnl/Chilomastix_caulleri/4758:147-320(+)